jgi:hypothetical protein
VKEVTLLENEEPFFATLKVRYIIIIIIIIINTNNKQEGQNLLID